MSNVAEVGPYSTQGMTAAMGEVPHLGEVRCAGMLTAVELITTPGTRNGFATPPCLTRSEADAVISAKGDAIEEVLG